MPHTSTSPSGAGDPATIGPYRIVGRLGSGGMGVVHAALDRSGNRVAVKQVLEQYAHDPAFRDRFTREVDLMQRVSGPCVVPLLSADPTAPRPWLATPYVPGVTLDEYVRSCGPLTGTHLLALAIGVAGALDAIHRAGVVHRDLKPGNVILAPDGPRVLDFGIAHALDATAITRTGMMTGTPGWISPEQYQGQPGGPASDVFSWGSLVAFAATGRAPHGAGRPDVVAYRVMSAAPDLEGVPTNILSLVEASLAKEPGDRPSSSVLVAELRPLLAEAPTAQGTPAVGPTIEISLAQAISNIWTLALPTADTSWQIPGSRGRRAWWLAAVGVASAATAAALTIALLPSSQQSHSTTTASASRSPRAVTSRTVTATSSLSAATGPAASTSPPQAATGQPIAAGGCIEVTYKLPGGPSQCKSLADICTLGAPWYLPNIDQQCGAAPVARVFVTGTAVINTGACLVNNGTPWATASTSYNPAGTPAAACSATIDRTQADAGGNPLKVCQPVYPDTRLTFLADVTAESGGSTTACLTQEAGA